MPVVFQLASVPLLTELVELTISVHGPLASAEYSRTYPSKPRESEAEPVILMGLQLQESSPGPVMVAIGGVESVVG